jgi:hypothetical protein
MAAAILWTGPFSSLGGPSTLSLLSTRLGRSRPVPSAREHCRYDIVVRKNYPRGEANETDCAYYRGYGCRFGMRNDAQDPDLPGRVGDRLGCALSATAAATTAAAAAPDNVSGWKNRCGRHGVSSSTASTAPVRSASARPSWGKGLEDPPDRLSPLMSLLGSRGAG